MNVNGDQMLTLYHGDSSVCAAKVRLTLIEKGLRWEGRLLDLNAGEQFSPEYLRLNPNAVVPTLVHDDAVIIESTIINEYLEEAFPVVPLMPGRPEERAQARLWTHQENSIHGVVNTVTTAILFRDIELQKTPAERAARVGGMPDPERRAKWLELIDRGLESHLVLDALVRFARLFSDMERQLGRQPWLTGEVFGLADIGFLSYFHRLRMLGMASAWENRFARLTSWLERACARPSFSEAVTDYIGAAKRDQYHRVQALTANQIAERFTVALSRV